MSGRGRGGRGSGGGGARGGAGGAKLAAPPSVAGAPPFAAPVLSSATEAPPRFPAFPIPEPKDPSARDLSSIRFAEDLRRFMATSPFFLPARTGKEAQKIDRYSDKYVAHLQAQDESGKIHAIVTDLSFFPEELHSVYNTSKARRHASSAPPLHAFSFTDTLAKVRDLERGEDGGVEVAAGEEGAEDEDGDGEKTRDGEEDDEAVFEEEDLEDETDYNLSYFDNGEEYGGADYDDGDGMRAPHETQCNA